MAADRTNKITQTLRVVALRAGSAGLSDDQLLGRFVDQRDEAAFEALVRRHGPMVFGVCRRVLHNGADAEDAFQTVFIVLVRKASSIRRRELLGSWLYTVAYQTALKARRLAGRRQSRERQVTEMPEPIASGLDRRDEVLPLLDRELSRLPDKYRIPIILCDLEGKTHKDAAGQLGCPEGTVSSRLSRARSMLARRLGRCGLAVTAGALAALSHDAARAAVPAHLTTATVKTGILAAAGGATAGIASAKTAALTDAMLKAMFLNKLKGAGLALLAVTLIAVGAGAAASRPAASADPLRRGEPRATFAAPLTALPLDEGASTAPRDGAVFRLVSANSGRCLSVYNRVKYDAHAALGPVPRDAGRFEEWELFSIGDCCQVVNVASGMALTVPPGAVDQVGAQILQRDRQVGQKPVPPGQDPPRLIVGGVFPQLRIEDQMWRLAPNGKGYSLQTYLGGLALAVSSREDRPLIEQGPFVPGRADQGWILRRVDDSNP